MSSNEQTALDLGEAAAPGTATAAEAAEPSKRGRKTPPAKRPGAPRAAGRPDQALLDAAGALFEQLDSLDLDTRIETLNALRLALHQHSPFQAEPIDCVLWWPQEHVHANNYNPNVVAPPQKKILRRSIEQSGFTTAVVAWPLDEDSREVEIVDGFHRSQVAHETAPVRKRLHGRLPISLVRPDRRDRVARIEATIVHNEARGKHTIGGEEDVVLELSRLGKTPDEIAEALGMAPDKVLRLKQETGLAELHAEQEFSEAFEATTPFEELPTEEDDTP